MGQINGKITGANRRLAKKRVQCLNEALYFVSRLVLVDSSKSASSPSAKNVSRNPMNHRANIKPTSLD